MVKRKQPDPNFARKHLNILPLAKLSRSHGLLLPSRLLSPENIQLALRPPRLKIVPALFALYTVLLQNTQEFHNLFDLCQRSPIILSKLSN